MKIQTFIFNWQGQYEKTKEKQKQLSAIGVVPVVINSDDNHREDDPNWHNIGEESYFTAQFLKAIELFDADAMFHIQADALKDSYTQEYNGNFEASYKLMEALITEKPNEYLYQYRAGWIAYIGGHFSQSLVHYARAIVIDQSSLEPRVAQLKPLMALGKFREVETTCKSILQLDPKNYTAKSTLAFLAIACVTFSAVPTGTVLLSTITL